MTAVVAALMRRDGRVLVAQRPVGKRFGGRWEFPGGKLEAGESPEAALERELREELGVVTRTGRVRHAIAGGDALILFYDSILVEGEPYPCEGQAIDWLPPSCLPGLDMTPADQVVARMVADGTL